jgi:gamma-glutamylcyclotransferase (GGCT)/AIG2-like uncharacterized protein YtfP
MENKEKKHKIAVYGTLRKGQGNNKYCLSNSKYLGTTNTEKSFKMYSSGGFPIVTKGERDIEIDVYEVADEDLNKVYRLEGYTGVRDSEKNWYNTIDVKTKFGVAEMFIMNENSVVSLSEIESGNWLNR